MNEKIVSNMNRDELTQFIQTEGLRQHQAQNGAPLPPLACPKELSDVNTPPALRAQVLAAYTGALIDRPQNTWSSSDRALMAEQIRSTLRGMGY
jgi:hypothetical protein